MRRLLLAITLFATTAMPVAAERLTREQVDAIVQPAVQMEYVKGLAVGVIDREGRDVFGYGITADGGEAPDARTVFEIGSVSKTFTATLLAIAVEGREVRLDQPVRELLPPGVKVPSRDGVEITLEHLATHMSGLPRMPRNFAPADEQNPYADYTPEQLYDALSSITLWHTPGTSSEYSNLGAGLLGHALARKAGKTYEQLLIERICLPLKMNDTRCAFNDDLRKHLAPGHDSIGEPAPTWDFVTMAGAGGIRSTADDMLSFLSANLGLTDSPLRNAMTLAQQRHAAMDDTADIALGWMIGKRTGARWHNGHTGGYHSFIAFAPDKKLGVVLLCNTASGLIDQIGTQLMQAMLGEEVQPMKMHTPIAIDPRQLDDYAGRYQMPTADVFVVTRKGDALYARLGEQPQLRIHPEAIDQFFYYKVDAQISFERGDDGNVRKLIVHQKGLHIQAPRIK
jgi:D-alanyl-D-alanine-carboxypeptidase/D-alanyl-D-alanine-endopeptidase